MGISIWVSMLSDGMLSLESNMVYLGTCSHRASKKYCQVVTGLAVVVPLSFVPNPAVKRSENPEAPVGANKSRPLGNMDTAPSVFVCFELW